MNTPEIIPADKKMGDLYLVVKIVAEIAGVILTLRMIDSMANNGPSQQAKFWDRVGRACRRSALELGKLGMVAEMKYKELTQP